LWVKQLKVATGRGFEGCVEEIVLLSVAAASKQASKQANKQASRRGRGRIKGLRKLEKRVDQKARSRKGKISVWYLCRKKL
jgi:hypothetical protein